MSINDVLMKAVEGGNADIVATVASLMDRDASDSAKRMAHNDLAKMQSALGKVIKNKSAGGRYDYATFDAMVAEVGPILTEHNFGYTFDTYWDQRGEALHQVVTCSLLHNSGHIIKTSVRAPIDPQARMNETQKAGSALTYGKRYAFAAATGVAIGDDDDAQAQTPRRSTGARPRTPVDNKHPSMDQLKRMHTIATNNKWTAEQVKAMLKERYNVDSSKELTIEQYNQACDSVLPEGPSDVASE